MYLLCTSPLGRWVRSLLMRLSSVVVMAQLEVVVGMEKPVAVAMVVGGILSFVVVDGDVVLVVLAMVVVVLMVVVVVLGLGVLIVV